MLTIIELMWCGGLKLGQEIAQRLCYDVIILWFKKKYILFTKPQSFFFPLIFCSSVENMYKSNKELSRKGKQSSTE